MLYRLSRLPQAVRFVLKGALLVVQFELGWTRKLAITVPCGAAKPSRVLRHSLLGSAES
jgi:hypothetical protein